MNLQELFEDKSIKVKAKAAQIGDCLLNGELHMNELLIFAEKQKAANKATCIEGLEYATKKNIQITDERLFIFVVNSLKVDEPRVKWESAKVVGNVARLYPDHLAAAIENLLLNTENPGTVVRWATAYALAEILKLKTNHNEALITRIEKLGEQEEDNGVKKKYLDALKRVKK